MAKLRSTVNNIYSPQHREICAIAFDGIISTPTVSRFREDMNDPITSGRDVIIDLSNVNYINSSGLGELVRINDALEKNSLSLMIVNTDEEMARLIRMLGLLSVLHVFPTIDAALEGIDKGLKAKVSDHHEGATSAGAQKPARKQIRGGAFVPTVSTPAPKLPDARIMLGVNGDQHFHRFLARCLCGRSDGAVVVRNKEEALASLDGGRIDVAIIDSTIPEAREICSELKTRQGNGILSVIFIYPSEEDHNREITYRVAEDEFVVEPFEVREMVALAQSEFSRCKSESILFVQEACFEFETRDQSIAQTNDTIEKMLLQTGLPQEASDGFFYAIREAIDNARRHGNVGDPSKMIEVLYVLDKEKITVTCGDEGGGFDFLSQIKKSRDMSPIQQARDRHSAGGYGGLGIGLMLRCCDKVEYLPPGNIVKLTKYL
ncbi:MAG: anti-sigma factor antagonist [Planctomycetes bacterium]|nr:anti-sigma factor antagonist [Planctomycetota bacterium]